MSRHFVLERERKTLYYLTRFFLQIVPKILVKLLQKGHIIPIWIIFRIVFLLTKICL